MHDSYCNPLNLNYRFQIEGWADECLREAADPSVVRYKDEYWLFASKSGGYWHSSDLRDWHFIQTRMLPTENYAPDVRVIDDALYFTAGDCPVFRTTDPEADEWQELPGSAVDHSDPNMFQDDDGRAYLYWGCSNRDPIYGVEMDPQTMTPIGEPVQAVSGDPGRHGWERNGENNADDTSPWVEGAWVTKHNGTYYLQYAAPGTEWNVYADGVYHSQSPLGPFQYCPHSPFSLKPGGFITGAGHGSTFWDHHGNLWHIATMRISVKHNFERRIGLFPAGFDNDGILYCNTSFGDYPTRLPNARWDPWTDPSTDWMLLSYAKPVTASSSMPGCGPGNAVDEDIRTYWSASSGEPGEWLQVDLGARNTVHAIQINFAEHDCQHYGRGQTPLYHQYLLEASDDGRTWRTMCDTRDNAEDVPHDYVQFPQPLQARHIRMTNHHVPAHGTFAVSGLRLFGRGSGDTPDQAPAVSSLLDPDDPLSAHVSWSSASRAIGYNVHWGLSPKKLYNSWLIYGRTRLALPSLNRDVAYWVRVDAFNENGVTTGNTVPVRPAE